ncbi:MAG: hypothetical protein ABI977_15075 [Acidobacteriota bacterium]
MFHTVLSKFSSWKPQGEAGCTIPCRSGKPQHNKTINNEVRGEAIIRNFAEIPAITFFLWLSRKGNVAQPAMVAPVMGIELLKPKGLRSKPRNHGWLRYRDLFS